MSRGELIATVILALVIHGTGPRQPFYDWTSYIAGWLGRLVGAAVVVLIWQAIFGKKKPPAAPPETPASES